MRIADVGSQIMFPTLRENTDLSPNLYRRDERGGGEPLQTGQDGATVDDDR